MKLLRFALAVASLALIACAPFLAFSSAVIAQEIVEAPTSIVNFDPFIAQVLPYVFALATAIITAAVAWATKKFNDWTGMTIEARHREAFQSALFNGARAMLATYTPSGVAVDLKSIPLATGVQFVLNSVPDAVKYFGLTAADIERHLTPKLVALTGSK